MVHRIEIAPTITDTRATVLERRLHALGFTGITDVSIIDAYTVDGDLRTQDVISVARMLHNPVTQRPGPDIQLLPHTFDWALEVGFLPGVTDNEGNTARVGLEDLLGTSPEESPNVYSSQLIFLSGDIPQEQVQAIASNLGNPLIQQVPFRDHEQYVRQGGSGLLVPRVMLHDTPPVDTIDLLAADDHTLTTIGKKGIENADGSRRGTLALDLTYMKAITEYFRRKGRNPTDIELESLAQTWSEHCHHTIFADPIDDITDGLYKKFIKGATQRIRKEKGDADFCVSVFTDNSGAIIFDDKWLITDKAETHNSPSALDPFGGSITGIVGVNRDALGFGMGAMPIFNGFGYCLADPKDTSILYKGEGKTQRMLSARQIMEGIVEGVNVGGNCSGIPTPQGFVRFDERYRGKPLVFVRTGGLIPRKVNEKPSHEKGARPGDYIVMIGGRVGKDGIHGATFSSEALGSGSPATAVQIGDPITQKIFSDVIVREARDRGLYTSITDNGAGGLSCSVAEMAKESGGCHVKLGDVPLKYQGLAPWEIWISESQERMTLAVPPEKWEAFSSLMQRRGVEATVIGEFTDSGNCVVEHGEKVIMDLEMDFLHDGLPQRPMKTTYTRPNYDEPELPELGDLTTSLHSMLGRLNVTSFEFISQQYDHEVQGGSVLKPLQGRGRINADASVIRPVLDSQKGVVLSQGITPSYSDIDTYHMAAAAIDTAIRNAISAGGNLDHLALMDNFCWCSSNESERLGQLKAAAEACFDTAVAYGTPFISGKDSMFNDFKGFDENGEPTVISVPPTLLISSMSVMDDARKAVSLDAKFDGDLVYVLGETHDELGGSEFYAMRGEETQGERFIGNTVPKVDVDRNKALYRALAQCIDEGLVASAQSVNEGGLAVALAKTAMGGLKGMDVSLDGLAGSSSRDDFALFSQSQGRVVVTINPEQKDRFEEIMGSSAYTEIGKVTDQKRFVVKGKSGTVVNTSVDSMLVSYKSTLRDY